MYSESQIVTLQREPETKFLRLLGRTQLVLYIKSELSPTKEDLRNGFWVWEISKKFQYWQHPMQDPSSEYKCSATVHAGYYSWL